MKTKKKVLIIEDDKFLIKLYSDKLTREGFEVSMAISGEEGLNKVAVEKPDMVLLDIILPQKNGFEILSEMKLNPKTKNIPVVLLTNLGQEADIKKGLELGAVNYVVKTDFSITTLAQIVRESIARRIQSDGNVH